MPGVGFDCQFFQKNALSVERKKKSYTKKQDQPSFEIAPRECWQLSAGDYIGAFVCLFRTELHILNQTLSCCCFFSPKMVPFTFKSEAYFPECASWRITPLECLWEERERESEREKYKSCFHFHLFSIFRFNPTLNWKPHTTPHHCTVRNPYIGWKAKCQ